MFVEVLTFLLLGILFGLFTGIFPGIHVNSVAILFFSFLPLLISIGIPNHALIVFIISLAITHTFADFIPSIFLGAPEDSTALSVLPGHKMLLEGNGLEALFLTVTGGLFATLTISLLSPFLLYTLPLLYFFVKPNTHIILITILFLMVLTEKKPKKIIIAMIIVSFSGFLGYITFNYPLISQNTLFFPLFTGLFGISTLLISLRNKDATIPPQEKFLWKKIKSKLILSATIKSFFSSMLLGILPGVGASQATVLAQELTHVKNKKDSEKERKTREFLISVGGINTAVAIFSILSLYTIGRARSGAAIVIGNILGSYAFSFGTNELILLISSALFTIGIASICVLYIGRRILHILERIPHRKVSLFVIIFLVILAFFLSGIYGLFVLILSTLIGLIAPLYGIKRSHAMGVLIVPIIFYYSGMTPPFLI